MSKLILLLCLQDSAASPLPRRIMADLPAVGVPVIAGTAVNWKALPAALKEHAASGYRILTVRADNEVPFSTVRDLMTAARDAGIESVQFSTETPAAPPKLTGSSKDLLRIKVRKSSKGTELLLLQESSLSSLEELRRKLKDGPKLKVVIDAEHDVLYSVVRQIIEACTSSGFKDVSFATALSKNSANTRDRHASNVRDGDDADPPPDGSRK